MGSVQIRRVDASVDRQIITGMVVSTKFLKGVQPLYRPELLKTAYAITIARWCFAYLDQYGQAPGADIHRIFSQHERSNKFTDAQLEEISTFLTSLESEFEHGAKFNADYLLDQTEKLFTQRHLQYLAEDIQALLDSGDVEGAERLRAEYKPPTRSSLSSTNPLQDMDGYINAYESRKEPLFELPGVLGDMLNPHFIRGGFMALMGRAKVGKTWRMIEIAMRAARARCNVAIFQLGDLTKDDYMIRQGVYVSGKSNDPRYCGELLVPVQDCLDNQKAVCPFGRGSGTPVVDSKGTPDLNLVGSHKTCARCLKKRPLDFKGAPWWEYRAPVEPLGWREAYKNTQKWAKLHKAGRRLRLEVRSNSSTTVKDIERQLDIWEEVEGFVPDVIILDYADIMAPEDSRKEKRHQEDERWRALRRLTQERFVFLLTATQSNRGGMDGEDILPSNMSEDKRKADHVTAFFAINQTDKEDDLGIIRIAPLLVREGKLKKSKQVVILQSLETGKPYISSYYHTPKKK